MKSISKLKDDARKHELREEWEKAVQVYLQVLKIGDQGEGEVELPLYNRVGDLYVRLGRAQDAVRYYEQAADRYADAGLFNNAIALCNKAMRYQPHQLSLLRKLGMFSAMQGFYADARRYFTEYADKQIALGKVDDALNALSEFARIADDADSRELLGRRLHERGRTGEAVAELRTAHGMRVRAGQTDQAEALKHEIRTIDPSARLEEDARPRPPSGSFGADLPGLSHFDTDPLAEADVDLGSGTVQLDESGTDYGLVDISSFDDMESAGHHGVDTFQDPNLQATGASAADALLGAEEEEEQPFDLPLLADFTGDAADDFGVTGGAALDESAFGGSTPGQDELELPGDQPADELAEFADFDPPGEDLPYLDDSIDAIADVPEGSTDVAGDLDFDQLGELDSLAEWPDFTVEADQGAAAQTEGERDFNATADFADWPEDPGREAGASLDERPPAPDPTRRRGNADDTLLDVNLDDFGAWDQDDTAAVEEMALEAAAATERAIREAEEAERREAEEAERRAAEATERRAAEEAERRAAEAREAAARELAAREAAEREAVAREAAAREAAEREAEARAAAREAERREAEARAAAEREAEARAAAAREAERREAEARAAAEREAEARAAAAREAEARAAAAREAEAQAAAAREAEARAAAAREAEARAAAAREAAAKEAAAREAAARQAAAQDPWAAGPRGARPPDQPTRGATPSPATPARPAAPGRDDYIDLGSLFTDDDTESTRFRIHEALPTGDEDEDFAELLSRFKEKVAEHLPPEDAAAHYDLGLAFKEMGLVDEAIAEFQVALRTGHMRLKVYEELGYCFLHKQQYNIAEKVLRQALQVEHRHELELLGIYYQLGRAYEAMGRLEQARDAYERVLGMDLHFQDTSERLARL